MQTGARVIARHAQNIGALWPVVAAVFMLVVYGAQASAKISEHDVSIKDNRASIDRLTVGLATINANQITQAKQLETIQITLDEMRDEKAKDK